MKARHLLQNTLLFAALSGLAGIAYAHSGTIAGSGFLAGFAHPLGGLDHTLAMVAVGLWASQLGGAALWRLPLAFIGMMIVGGMAAMFGAPLPAMEPGIIGSVVVLGALVALATRLPVWAGMGLAGLFALFHGHAHGTEMPLASEPLLYAGGFACATVLLHALGVAAGLGLNRDLPARLVRLGGGAIALTGVYLAVGF